MKVSDLLRKDDSSEQGPTQQQQKPAWLQNHGPEYDKFASNFVSPRQSVFHLHNGTKGSEQFGAHVNAQPATAQPTNTTAGMTPGEQTVRNTTA